MSIPDANLSSQFLAKLRHCTVTPDCKDGRPYISTRGLVKWMEATEPGHNCTNSERLLLAVYHNQNLPEPPISHSKISCGGADRCIIAFSILLEIRLGHMLHKVQREDIVDEHLPISLALLKEKFERIDSRNGRDYAERFDKAQWKFMPLVFRSEMDKDVPEQRIVPVCRKKEIGHGGQAQVFAIVVQADYVSDDLRARLSKDEHTRFDDPDFGDCFQFALKTFDSGQLAYFNDERQAFGNLKSNRGMIQYLGSFGTKETRIIDGHDQAPTHTISKKHILLEYGRFDLLKIFQYRLPPVTSPEIKTFWRSLVEIVDAVKGIHTLRTKNGHYHGWHNDIKPENIIVVDGSYKLADPGFAKFKKKLENDKSPLPKIVAGGGTITYAAPEQNARSRNSRVEVTQSVDIWSVGCVFSMAATWVVLGYQGIPQFQEVRRRAIDSIVRNQPRDESASRIDRGDFFHDGNDLLPAVRQWHQYLRTAVRRTDPITNAMLDFVETHLLISKRQISARKLYDQLRSLLDDCVAEKIPSELEHLMETLLCLDEQAQSIPQETQEQVDAAATASSNVPATWSQLKNLNVPRQMLKTASRFESLSRQYGNKSPKAEPTSPSLAQRHDYFTQVSNEPQQLHAGAGVQLRPNLSSSQPLLVGRRATFQMFKVDDGKAPERQNVIQAREQLRDGHWFKKHVDPVLETYFDNREIKFLVDNASSMEPYWDEATYLVETLVMKAKPFDKNGLDLYFTNPTRPHPVLSNEKSESTFRDKMRDMGPKRGVMKATNMIMAIENIFKEYFRKIEERKRGKKSPKEELTLIILTDGIWSAMRSPNEIYKYIEELLQDLEQRHIIGYQKRPVSIEFIQFGDNDDATERLRALDDDMEYKGYIDIIDHEMFSVTGNVRKMLLGSFVPFMDRSTKLSPTRTDTLGSTASPRPNARHSLPPAAISQYNGMQDPHFQSVAELPTSTQSRMSRNGTGSFTYHMSPEDFRDAHRRAQNL